MSNSGYPQNGGAPPQGLAQPVDAVPVQLNGIPRRVGRRERMAAWFRRGRPRQQVPANSAAGGVELAVVPEEAQARPPAMLPSQDQAAAPLNNSANGQGFYVGEFVGLYMGQEFDTGAYGNQDFAGLDKGTTAFLANAPAVAVVPSDAAGPGGVRFGRMVGCAQTGRVRAGGRVEQRWGPPQPAASGAPTQTSNFRSMGNVHTLGGDPSTSVYTPQHVGRA